ALDAEELARVRRRAGELRGEAVRVRLEDSPAARGFAERDDVSDLATRGPLTPDHSIYTKRVPAVLDSSSELDLEAQLDAFAEGQNAYFERHSGPEHGRLDPSPRWAVWRGRGTLAFGHTEKQLRVIGDLARHTCRAAQWAESLGGWRALGEREIFDVEYWELEQIKLRKGKKGAARPLEGKVAWVSGAASGIGRASAERLMAAGAAVVGLDIDPAISWLGGGGEAGGPGAGLGLVCDVADPEALERSRDRAVAAFGGVDIVVSNAGFFPSGETLENLDDEVWQRSLELNLTAHRRLLKLAIPLLRHGFDPAVIFIASKNVPAPGPAAGAYSAAKAGLTQLARVAALELGEDGIRVNVLHPDGVFDTGLWSEELIAQRAARYGLSPEGYRTQNVLGVEVRSADVARAVCCLAGTEFGVTTGAQIAVDGGNDRVL
ncbi:MAG: SDR family oxidoreductase, partial [Acidobacteriota bacterium]